MSSKAAILTVAGLTVISGGLWYLAQKAIPASYLAEQQAQQILSNTVFQPESGGKAEPAEEPREEAPKQLVQRSAALGRAKESLAGSLRDLNTARAKYLYDRAKELQATEGIDPEVWLVNGLVAVNKPLSDRAVEMGGFNGTAESQAVGKDLLLDAFAYVTALEWLYSGQPKDALVAPFEATSNVNDFAAQARLYRSLLEAKQAASQKQAEMAGGTPNE